MVMKGVQDIIKVQNLIYPHYFRPFKVPVFGADLGDEIPALRLFHKGFFLSFCKHLHSITFGFTA